MLSLLNCKMNVGKMRYVSWLSSINYLAYHPSDLIEEGIEDVQYQTNPFIFNPAMAHTTSYVKKMGIANKPTLP